MPQLVPFYFLNQLTYGFIGLYLILILVSQYILPYIIQLYIIRMIISKL